MEPIPSTTRIRATAPIAMGCTPIRVTGTAPAFRGASSIMRLQAGRYLKVPDYHNRGGSKTRDLPGRGRTPGKTPKVRDFGAFARLGATPDRRGPLDPEPGVARFRIRAGVRVMREVPKKL